MTWSMHKGRRVQDLEFVQKVWARYPDAEAHDPCPCGLTFVVLPAKYVTAELHYAIFDADLIEEARGFIERRPVQMTNHRGGDAVLVLCEVA